VWASMARARSAGMFWFCCGKVIWFEVQCYHFLLRRQMRRETCNEIGAQKLVWTQACLAEDKDQPKKQRHTAKRIFERLRDEHGYSGGITIVKDYVALWRQRSQEMFVPLEHAPGHAQVDFGEAIGIIGGAAIALSVRGPVRSAWQGQRQGEG
jgi:hypothetical protein